MKITFFSYFEMIPNEKDRFTELREQQLKTIDHTYVAPRTLFKTDFK